MRAFDDYPERRPARWIRVRVYEWACAPSWWHKGRGFRSSERIAHNAAAIATAVFWFLLGAGVWEWFA